MARTYWMLTGALAAATCLGGCTQGDLRFADSIAEEWGFEPGEPVVVDTGEGYDIEYGAVMRDIAASRGGRRDSAWSTVPRFGIHPGDSPAAGVPWNFPWPGDALEPALDGAGPTFAWPEDEAPAPAPPPIPAPAPGESAPGK